MADRPVFITSKERPYYQQELISFQFNPGLSMVQKQRNIRNLHDAFLVNHQDTCILEISSKSNIPLGIQLSAFYLMIKVGDIQTSLESAFQSSKVFEKGGPYIDLLLQPPVIAKKDSRLKESGLLTKFVFNGYEFPLEPKTFFYDWLYINAIAENESLSKEICEYTAFTDIEFNPKKSINCQARSAAIFVSIKKKGIPIDRLKDPSSFKKYIYDAEPIEKVVQQQSLFDYL